MTRPVRLLIAAAVAAGALLLMAAGMADTMVLKLDGATQPAVTFTHKAHSIDRGVACTECHHNMMEVGTPPCVSCHTLEGQGSTRKAELAYHDQCITCHKAAPDGTSAPTACEACHVPATPEPSKTP